ncbi:MAG TPA: BON domain-containing protein [Xanthobacteraceae bacterium]|nr:BON domain-containing protein [Xanthobacteraceae bacterium]
MAATGLLFARATPDAKASVVISPTPFHWHVRGPLPQERWRKIRLELLHRLDDQSWTDFGERNVIVSGGIVHLWGLVGSADEHKALLASAEGVPDVISVSDEMIPGY